MKSTNYNKIINSEEFKSFSDRFKDHFIMSGDIEYDLESIKLIKEVSNAKEESLRD